MEGNALRFAQTAKALGQAAHRLDLYAPAFRSPPRPGRGSRTVQRRGDEDATVSVAVRDRPWPAVVADMIEGVVVANELDETTAGPARDALWEAVGEQLIAERPAEPAPPRTTRRRSRTSARPPGHAAAA